MAKTRLELHQELLDASGIKNIYYQPPETLKMKYPCIVYTKDNDDTERADNIIYKKHNRYSVTIIDRDPDSSIPDTIEEHFTYCDFDRTFRANDLNHFVFSLYY